MRLKGKELEIALSMNVLTNIYVREGVCVCVCWHLYLFLWRLLQWYPFLSTQVCLYKAAWCFNSHALISLFVQHCVYVWECVCVCVCVCIYSAL